MLTGAALTGAAPVGATPADATTAGPTPAGSAPAGSVKAETKRTTALAPGVEYQQLDLQGTKGPARAHVLSVDLTDPRVRLGLLYPGAVAARATVSELATAEGAIAGVNGDFFNITEAQHPGVEATGASVGPAIAGGRALKAAVPNGQRFGPALPPGTTTEDVIGVGRDRRARVERLTLDGSVTTPEAELPLGGLNQYALPVGSVGAFTDDWGSASRLRATCGTDTERAAPCSTDTYEVTVRHGRVVSTADAPGGGQILRGTTVLVGREAGAQELRKFHIGEPVRITHRLRNTTSPIPLQLAVGGYPVLHDGQPLPGLDTRTAAVRTAAGIADGGRRVLLLALDGSPEYRTGLTVAEIAQVMRGLGAEHALNLDGGGSTTLVARTPDGVTPLNHPSAGSERPVPNGIGVFTGP
ncbi:phosphodiester glycosidase family protein [Streptomyces sp. NPDC096205]|uniref:phosphodiester glycosidase family protein n=1 Tax=Streptomyces sp. NPDC096205 TaxID=3366081 RepID=UPI003826C3C8